MEFKQPTVEFVNIQSSQVVFASFGEGAGGTISCNGSAPGNCQTAEYKAADTAG